jgi:diaminopimelate epimerase
LTLLFQKYHGTGNDFIVADNRSGLWDSLSVEQRHALCHRRFGIGADGILLLNKAGENAPAAFRMEYFNADGKQGSFCGNGSRCLLAFASEHLDFEINTFVHFEASDGMHSGKINPDGSVSVQMRKGSDIRKHVEGYLIDTGSPHLVIKVQNAADIDVYNKGKALRHSPEFGPGGLNVNFYHEQQDGSLFVRTYERGVEDETFSCGTGVTAVALVHSMQQGSPLSSVTMQTPGGFLKVDIPDSSGGAGGPVLSGPAVSVFTGTITF